MLEFDLLAGEVPTRTAVVARPNFPTGFRQALLDNDVTADDVDLVGGLRARVVALNGEDFSEYERIEVRACPIGSPGGCNDIAFIMFSQSDLFLRRDQTVNLNPSLVNFRDLFLGNDNVRIEVTFRSGTVTSRNIPARLEWAINAVGDLD